MKKLSSFILIAILIVANLILIVSRSYFSNIWAISGTILGAAVAIGIMAEILSPMLLKKVNRNNIIVALDISLITYFIIYYCDNSILYLIFIPLVLVVIIGKWLGLKINL